MVSVNRDIQPTRGGQTTGPGHKQRAVLGIRASDIPRRGIADIIQGGSKSIAAEEQHESAVWHLAQRRRLCNRAVSGAVGDELDRCANFRESVVGAHLLQHNRRGHDGRDAIVTVAAVAERVAVDFVDDPARAVLGGVAGWVDGAALRRGTDPWLVRGWLVGAGDGVGDGDAKAVQVWLRGEGGGVVHCETCCELDDIRRPDHRVRFVDPGGQIWEGVLCAVRGPSFEIGAVCHWDVDGLAVDSGVC